MGELFAAQLDPNSGPVIIAVLFVVGVLLVAFVAWVAFFHLPDTHRQIGEIVLVYNERTDKKDARIDQLATSVLSLANQAREELLTSSNQSRAEFKQALDTVVNHCTEENTKQRDSWERSLGPKIREVVAEENQKALEKVLARRHREEERRQ